MIFCNTLSRYGASVPAAYFPVFSMHGSDCVRYGSSLWNWLALEFPELQLEALIPAHWHRSLSPADPGLYEHWSRYVE